MSRTEINTDQLKIDQKPPIFDPRNYDGDVVMADRDVIDRDYANELAFMEEAVTIRLEPTAEKNAPTIFPVWVNGKGAEVFQNGRWDEITYLPVGRELTVKRKALEVMVRAKVDAVHTAIQDPEGEHPNNVIQRFTTAVHSITIIKDGNPKGAAWLTDMRRRNL